MDRTVGLMSVASAARTRPRVAMVAGALGVATSGIFIDLSGTSPGTASFFRCVLALPLLLPLAVSEHRMTGGPSRRQVAVAAAAGVLFAADAVLWTQAIYEVGAGMTAVLVNAQVIIFPLLALIIDRERLGRTFLIVLPIVVAGILLTGGVVESGTVGTAPVWGTIHAVLAALCYSGFLFLLRRGGNRGPAVQSYTIILISAAVVAVAIGGLWQGISFTPGWGALGWLALTAVASQVLGWLLVALVAARLTSTVSAALLLLTPVGAILLAAIVLGELPTGLQLIGCVLILVGAYVAAASRGIRIPRARQR